MTRSEHDLASNVVVLGSCGKELRSRLSSPGRPGVVLVSYTEGIVSRYEHGALRPMLADLALPHVGVLLGLEGETSPLHLL